jgi:hypothetical protein
MGVDRDATLQKEVWTLIPNILSKESKVIHVTGRGGP